MKPNPNDHQTLDAIKSFNADRGYLPTRVELGQLLGLSSTASVQARIDRLVELGWVEVDRGSRAMRILK